LRLAGLEIGKGASVASASVVMARLQQIDPFANHAVNQAVFPRDTPGPASGERRIRILELVEAIMRDPFEGAAKPEPLRYAGIAIRFDPIPKIFFELRLKNSDAFTVPCHRGSRAASLLHPRPFLCHARPDQEPPVTGVHFPETEEDGPSPLLRQVHEREQAQRPSIRAAARSRFPADPSPGPVFRPGFAEGWCTSFRWPYKGMYKKPVRVLSPNQRARACALPAVQWLRRSGGNGPPGRPWTRTFPFNDHACEFVNGQEPFVLAFGKLSQCSYVVR